MSRPRLSEGTSIVLKVGAYLVLALIVITLLLYAPNYMEFQNFIKNGEVTEARVLEVGYGRSGNINNVIVEYNDGATRSRLTVFVNSYYPKFLLENDLILIRYLEDKNVVYPADYEQAERDIQNEATGVAFLAFITLAILLLTIYFSPE